MKLFSAIFTLTMLLFLAPSAVNAAGWVLLRDPGNSTIIYDIRAQSLTDAYAVGTNGTILRTTDSTNWTNIAPGGHGSATFYGVDAVSSTVFVVGVNTILRSTNSGSSWANVTPAGLTLSGTANLRSVDFVDANRGWAVGDQAGGALILRTTNGGATWTSQQSNLPPGITRLNDISCVSASTCFAVGDGGRIVRTMDGGNSWVSQTSGTTLTLEVVKALTSSIVWAAGRPNGTVLTTANGGGIWTLTNLGSSTTSFFELDLLNSEGGVVVGGSGRTYQRTASGWSNFLFENNLTPDMYAVDLVLLSAGFGGGEGGRIFRFDDSLPSVGSITPVEVTAGSAAVFTASYSDDVGVARCEFVEPSAGPVPAILEAMTLSVPNGTSGTASISYAFAAAGTHSLRVECEDRANNRFDGPLTTITVVAAADTELPSAPTNVRMTSPATDTTPSFSWDASTDNVGVDAYRVSVTTLRGANLGLNTVVESGLVYTVPDSNPLAPGEYSFEVWAIDTSNNSGPRTQIFFTIELAAAPADGGSVPSDGGASSDGGSVSDGGVAPLGEEPATPAGVLPAGFQIGDLVKLADDGNPNTFGDSSVFYLGADGNRYVFPNDKAYFTWYVDFSGVKIISTADLASIPLRGNVTYRPGIKMVKLQTSPVVYVVERGGVLRAVPSEEIARALYGTAWNQRIDDINDAFWSNYRVHESLASSSDYDSVAARNSASTINIDKGIVSVSGDAVP